MKKFTLVSTVFNEESRLRESIEDIENQSLKPSEIVIVDAGSSDGTLQILHDWKDQSSIKINVIVKEKCNVAEGRNLAIESSTYDLIVSTDFGCRFAPGWLFSLVACFNDEQVEVVGGNYTVLESQMTTMPAKAAFLLSNKYEMQIDESFIPSSRSIAYKKYVWQKVGKYPEWLTLAADDYVFGVKFQKMQFNYKVVSEPYVFWLRHDSILGYAKESFRYGLGDGEAGTNNRNFISNSLELILRYTFFLTLLTGLFLWDLYALIVLVPTSLGLRSYFFALKKWNKYKSERYPIRVFWAMLPLIERTRLFYIRGYLRGYFFKSKLQKEGAESFKRFLDENSDL